VLVNTVVRGCDRVAGVSQSARGGGGGGVGRAGWVGGPPVLSQRDFPILYCSRPNGQTTIADARMVGSLSNSNQKYICRLSFPHLMSLDH
jgi:hypothetical protein